MSSQSSSDLDLLKFSPYGGCSAKLDPSELTQILASIPLPKDPNLLVGADTHDDAGVYRLSDELALIFTTDFFPPVVGDPRQFGRIAAANALSDIYAMGGKPLMALNLVHYPAESLPLTGLKEILSGAASAVQESGAMTVGGHTIQDSIPQFGLAVVGTVHPSHLITNKGAMPGQLLILTKPLGVGVLLAGKRLGLLQEDTFRAAVESMSRLNKTAAECMVEAGVQCATDVTGFGLVGHAKHIAQESEVTLTFDSSALPVLPEAIELLSEGCIPGGGFRNLRYVGEEFDDLTMGDYGYLVADPQTSGGILMAVDADSASTLLDSLHKAGDIHAAIVGEVSPISSEGTLLRLI